ncbi:unnamed protein product [Linum tenue]|uniref:Photosystem II 5 kDa protein, chloroplastic n=3 Tax=Linum tenue TaxID=586396 RepID=A0AAV0JSK2_9ROSI|nr:unnamed protein product [Linum tenue]
MASMTMAASFLAGSTMIAKPITAPRRGLIMAAKASSSSSNDVEIKNNKKEESNNGRRDLMFGAAAAAAYSIARAAMADEDEPKRGTPQAKKKYAPVCVTNPTARICRY